jgi:hypothetical protein
MSLNIGTLTTAVLAAGALGLLITLYLFSQVMTRLWAHGNTILILIMIISWGVYVVILGACIAIDNPSMEDDDDRFF